MNIPLIHVCQCLARILPLLIAVSLGVPELSGAGETDQEMPLGAVGGTVHADPFTGTATTSIPIEVASGRGGVKPNLALVYESANGNGWVGMGWKLEEGVIERQTKFGVDYAGDDYVFRLSGINVELVNVGNNEYRAKFGGSFTRIKKLTALDGQPYFEATDTMGTRFIFGSAPATRTVDQTNANHIFRWFLERAEDVHGNYMTLSYTSDQGQTYLTQIDYTGNDNGELPTTNQVKFYLEDRPDVQPMYVSNFLISTAKRLKTIEIRGHAQLINAYSISYSYNNSSNNSLLASLKRYGKDANIDGQGNVSAGSHIQVFSADQYTSETVGLKELGSDGWPSNGEDFYRGDYNGDGKLDFLVVAKDGGSGWTGWKLYLATGIGFTLTSEAPSPSHGEYFYVGDYNGDGKSDFVVVAKNKDTGWDGWKLYLATGNGFTLTNSSTAAGYCEDFHPGDFNGDGQDDLLVTAKPACIKPGTTIRTLFTGILANRWEGWRIYSSSGNGFTLSSQGIGAGYGEIFRLGDYNGDGKSDFMVTAKDGLTSWPGWKLYLATGSGFSMASQGTGMSYNNSFFPGDYNGDGKLDFVVTATAGLTSWAGWKLYLATGSGFVLTNQASSPGSCEDFRPGDFDGDGKTDLLLTAASVCGSGGSLRTILRNPINTNWSLYSFTGSGLVPISNGTYSGFGGQTFLGDFSGDGKADILRVGTSSHAGWKLLGNTQDPPSHLLTKLSFEYGNTTTIRYMPSTLYSNTQLPYPVQTVNFIKTNDGNGHVATTTYDYAGGFHHLGEREFRGFNYVKVTGQAGATGEQTITETWFHQGNDTAVDVNNPTVPDGYLKGAPYRVKVTDGTGAIYTETTTTYTADNNGQAPFFAPPQSVVTSICDGSSCGKQTRTDFTYDTYGNVTREDQYGDTGTAADDRTVTRAFASNTTAWILGLPTRETIYQGLGTATQVAHTDFYYDGTSSCSTASSNQTPTLGNLTRTVKWLNGGTSPETRMAYDAYGNVICTRDARGKMTTMAYDPSGTFATTVTNALGHQTSTTYYGVNGVATNTGLYGQVKSVTDPNGAVTTTTYDGFGRRLQVTQPNGFWTKTSYNSFGTVGSQHVRTDSQAGLSTWTYFDGLGRTTKTRATGTDGKIVTAAVQYDNRGSVTQRSLPVFEPATPTQWTTFAYDPLGRTIKTTNPDNSRGLACYDDWVTVSIDANNHRTRTVRDAYGRVAAVQEYSGTFTSCDTSLGTPYATTTYAYDVLGNLTTLTDAKGNVSTMTYDTLSRKTAMHDPDMGNWTYSYDAMGNLTQQTDAKNQTMTFQYDALNRRTLKDYVGGGHVVYTYDGATFFRKGRLQRVRDSSGTTTFYYDAMGQVTATDKLVDGTTYTTATTYDGLGRVLNLTYPNNSTVTHTYNGPQLQSVAEGRRTYASYSGFNAQGQPRTLTLGNGVVTTYTYDPKNFRLKTLKTVKGRTVLQDLRYTFDAGGNVTTLTDPLHGDQTLAYDALDRLTSASGAAYPTPLTYTYDTIGNLTTNSRYGGAYAYPASGSSSVRPHAVRTAGGHTYTYDANGNMVSGAGRTLAYDHENRPISVTKSGTTTTFVYDGDGGRVKKTVTNGRTTTATTYIGKLYVCEGTSAPLSCATMIFAGTHRLAMKQASGTVDYFHPDHLGSTSVLTNSRGVSQQALAYDPYGETRVNTSRPNATVEEWKLEVGTFAGGNDLYQSSGLGQQTTARVPNLPTDGSQVYVTLAYKIGGVWDHDNYVYTASSRSGGDTFPPPITTPAPESTLTTTTVTFTGGHTSQDVEHSLYVGSRVGAWNIYDSGSLGTGHTVTVAGLPTKGPIYVRWFSKNSEGTWRHQDHIYTMNVSGEDTFPPPIITPTPGATLRTSTVIFTGAHTKYDVGHWLYVGSRAGARNIYDSGSLGTGHTATVVGLPTKGPIYVRWFTRNSNGGWLYQDYTYTMNVGSAYTFPPPITTPAPESTLTTTTVTFTGGHTSQDVEHSLYVGSRVGAWNIYDSGSLGTGHTVTVAGLPTKGPIYVRWFSKNSKGTFHQDHTYMMNVSGEDTFPPPIITPTPGATLRTSTVIFMGAHTKYDVGHWLYVGSRAGARNIYDSGSLGTGHTATVVGLPTKGPIYVRWFTRNSNGGWLYQDYTYTMNVGSAYTFPPPITTPAPGSTLTTTTVTFTGGHTSQDVEHSLYVGSRVGAWNIYDSGSLGTGHTVTVAGLPTKGLIYVRWFSKNSKGTFHQDHIYTMNVSGEDTFPPPIITPTPGATLRTSTVIFTGAHTKYDVGHWLYVGSRAGARNIYDSGSLGTGHTATVVGLPTKGPIYVRWFTRNSSGGWLYQDHTYTMNVGDSAALPSEPPTMHLAALRPPELSRPSTLHRLDRVPPASPSALRLGGGPLSLRFGLLQEAATSAHPLVHLVTHGGTASTTISPAAGTVLSGATVTFSWSYTGSGSGAPDVAYKYTGKERDASTGLYFYEARYYDAALGRFISADTIVPSATAPQTLNRYSYANNNPIIYTDPSGHFGIGLAIAVGAIVGGVSAGIQSDWDVQATVTGAFIGGVAGGVGAGVGGAVSAAVGSQYGAIAGYAAGGLVGGAAAGGTSAIFYRAAGYNTNIGLAIATGAAGGLIAGGFYGVGNHYGGGLGGFAGSIASAPASGAVSAAITGNDPGAGALLAMRDFGMRMGVSAIVIASNFRFNQSLMRTDFSDDGRREVSNLSGGRPITTHTDVIGALQPGRYQGGSPYVSGNLEVGLAVSAAMSLVDGSVAIRSSIRGAGMASMQMAQLLGGSAGMELAVLRGAMVINGAGGAFLAAGGGYMVGSTFNNTFPYFGTGQAGADFYDFTHSQP